MSAARDHRVFHMLQLAAHKLKTRADRVALAETGVTAAQAAVMHVIASAPGTTQRQVADQLQQKEPAVAGMVARLLESGFLSRTPSLTDGRAWALSLTPSGEAAIAGFRKPLDQINAQLTEALGGEEEVERFALMLKAILDADL